MPDVSAEGGQEEADARKRSAAESCGLASTGPSSGEEREQERHGEVHDAVGGCADDTGDLMTPLQRPVAGIVFLKDAVIHGEAPDRQLQYRGARENASPLPVGFP